MSEQLPHGEGHLRTEIGIDGKPFEVWEPAPRTNLTAPPPALAGWNSSPGGGYGQGAAPEAFYPRGPAETATLETPRRTMEFNHFAWYSLGLGGFALVGAVIGWAFRGAGMGLVIGLGFAGVGAYYGLRSHNAGVRGFCTNGRLGLAGLILSVIAAIGTVGYVVWAYAHVATAVQGG